MQSINWGLIGAGDIVRKRIAPALNELENCNLVAVSRGRAELAEAFATEFGVEKWYANWREMLADGNIDAVYIASPVYMHAEHTIAAAEAGKHVLCEKPMAMDATQCDKMIAACKSSNVKLGVAYYRRFYPVLERVRMALSSGEIGNPVFAQINTFEYFNPGPDHPRRWFVQKEKSGGGPMMDFGCHRIEVLTDLFGEVKQVESIVASVEFKREVEDTAAVLFRFKKGPCASLVVTHAAQESVDTLDIFCTAGSIHITSLNSGEIIIKTAFGEKSELHPPSPNFHAPQIKDFADAVIHDRDPRVSGDTGRMIAKIEDNIYGR